MRRAQTLYSGILAIGSRAGLVNRLAAASLKWKGIKTMPGRDLSVTRAVASIWPRRVTRRTSKSGSRDTSRADRVSILVLLDQADELCGS